MIKRIIVVIIFVMIVLGIIHMSKHNNIKACKTVNQTKFFDYPLKQIVLDKNVSGNFFLLGSGTLTNKRTYLFYINDVGSSYKLIEANYKRVSISEVKGKPMAVLNTRDCQCRCEALGGCDPDKLIYSDDECVFWYLFLPPGTILTNVDINVKR